MIGTKEGEMTVDRLWFFFQRQIRDGVQSVIPIQYGEKQACIQQSRHAERPQPLSRWTPCLKISSARAEAWP